MDKGGYGEQLILLAAVLSFEIARGRSVDELSLLSGLFTIMGDNLALLATTRANLNPLMNFDTNNQNNAGRESVHQNTVVPPTYST